MNRLVSALEVTSPLLVALFLCGGGIANPRCASATGIGCVFEQDGRLPAAYRDAAVVATPVELHERTRQLQDQSFDLGQQLNSAHQVLSEHALQSGWADNGWQQVTRRLEGAYVAPAAAAERLGALVGTHGYDQVAEFLERRPAALGELRGTEIAGFRSAARQEAERIAAQAGYELRGLGGLRFRLAAAQPRVAAASQLLSTGTARANALHSALQRLPSARRLDRDLLRAASALGDRLLRHLVPRAGLALIQRAVAVARSLVRDNDRGLER